jgi:hypothetical protein
MANKEYVGRMTQKHDIEANWKKAINFIPKQAEIIVYDVEYDAKGHTLELPEGRDVPYAYERFKIGDGITKVNLLPFATPDTVEVIKAGSGKDAVTIGGSEPAYDSEWSEYTADPIALGNYALAGGTGYYGYLPTYYGYTKRTYPTEASGIGAFAYGIGAKSLGDGAHAEGIPADDQYEYFDIEHDGEIIDSVSVKAHGSGTEARGRGAHVEGQGTLAVGVAAHAEG